MRYIMNIEHFIDLNGKVGISGLFFAAGSFGLIEGNVRYAKTECDGKTVFEYSDASIRLQAEFTKEKNGVIIRRDIFKNLSNEKIDLYSLLSRFTLLGNAYEVYTQYSGWQHESQGEWQKLVTSIGTAAQGVWSCDSATPMMGFHDLYSGKNAVFHLIPNAQWQMTAKKVAESDREKVVLEAGFYDKGLCMKVAPGETIELPTIIFFQAENKTDLDAYRLHEVYNRLYPRKKLPILYNSWMYCFDKLDVDALLRQVDCAAEMGFEGFMIDAGWFGNGSIWADCVGDWVENMTGGPCGRLMEISERVREKGMVFGLWFEPERTSPNSKSKAEHPDYYFLDKFLDFSNPDAVDFITDALVMNIEKYHIGWLKLDFNSSTPADPSGNAFYRYMQGQKRFVEKLRQRYPDLYITGCAGGGYRMELGQAMLFDDFWLSDNQGPYEGIRIVKDTLKRMPSALIQRWNVQKYCGDFPVYPDKKTGRMIHCNDATWDFLIGINDSFSEAFMHGGPMGFSCDIDAFPAQYKKRWSDVIAQYKQDREFYKDATARILVDSDSIIAIEYADRTFNRCVIQIFTKTTYAQEIVLYPAVCAEAEYLYGDNILSGKDIKENGILIQKIRDNNCQILKMAKK